MSAHVLAVVATAVAVGGVMFMVVRPRRRLALRLRPWTAGARASLGSPLTREASPVHVVLVRPLLEVMRRVAAGVGGSDEQLARRLDQSGLYEHVPPSERLVHHRVRTAGLGGAGLGLGLLVGLVLPVAGSVAVLLGLLGAVVGATRPRGRVDARVRDRQERLQLELVTATQLLAMTIRIGGGVVQALQRFAARAQGLLATEVRDVLAQHAGGVPITDALRTAADRTPEPFVARTHRLLAAGAMHGSDLGGALLAHSHDVRTARRETLRRRAVRRRAAMLLPTIAVLAPVMLLFVAAPLPSIVFGVS